MSCQDKNAVSTDDWTTMKYISCKRFMNSSCCHTLTIKHRKNGILQPLCEISRKKEIIKKISCRVVHRQLTTCYSINTVNRVDSKY